VVKPLTQDEAHALLDGLPYTRGSNELHYLAEVVSQLIGLLTEKENTND